MVLGFEGLYSELSLIVVVWCCHRRAIIVMFDRVWYTFRVFRFFRAAISWVCNCSGQFCNIGMVTACPVPFVLYF